MVISKKSTLVIDSYDVEIAVTEFPFDGGEELHLQIEPHENIKYFGIMGNPEKSQTLSLKVGDAYMWINGDNKLLSMLEDAITKYKETWASHYQGLKGSANE